MAEVAPHARADQHPDDAHTRPQSVDDSTVAAVGRATEALEMVDQARGLLYAFHRLTGAADLALGDAVAALRDAGHEDLAAAAERELVGRNVIEGRWTFQVVEDYDDGYWTPLRDWERQVRDDLLGGRRHVQEAEMKERRRTHGLRHHEARPGE